LITDIDLAPRNSSGMVEYSADVHIIKPVDLSKGNQRIFYDVVNRGNKGHGAFNEVGGNNPTTAADAGTCLLMRRGYTLVFSGWEDEGLVPPGNSRALARLPIARNPDGSSVVGIRLPIRRPFRTSFKKSRSITCMLRAPIRTLLSWKAPPPASLLAQTARILRHPMPM
jgi:hypothetical protein